MNAMHPRKFLPAIRATVNESNRVGFRREREIVTTRFVGDVEIATGIAPFDAVRSDSSTSDTPLREQMRQLVPQGAIDLRAGVAVNRKELVIK